MIDKESLQKRFSRGASDYERYAIVQKKMASRVVEDAVKVGEKLISPDILEVGCGTGYLTRLLLEEFKTPNIVALDIAPGMIAESKKRFQNGEVEFRCEDIETAKLEYGYDLIVSNATFQWLNDLESTVSKLVRGLNEGGRIVFSTFGSETFCELYDSFEKANLERGLSPKSKLGQTFYSLSELKQVLENGAKSAGISCSIRVDEKLEYEYFESSKKFLSSIKKIGANNSNSELRIKSPGVIKRMMELYDEDYMERDGIRVSYHCFYGVLER